jgi:hypothetical protein
MISLFRVLKMHGMFTKHLIYRGLFEEHARGNARDFLGRLDQPMALLETNHQDEGDHRRPDLGAHGIEGGSEVGRLSFPTNSGCVASANWCGNMTW